MSGLSKAVQAELKQLTKKGVTHPERLVEFARDPTTAMHKQFEWDNSKAAAAYRLQQARGILQVWVEIVDGAEEPTRVMVSLSSDRAKGGYRKTSHVLSSKQMTERLFADAVDDLVAWRQRYYALSKMAGFTKLDAVFREVDRLAPKPEPVTA